ncbi:MAG: transglycosylase domain-containing protein [Cellulomonadaceae bacterium]|jgi:membrane peptidoglycan carboxypeptidase|nr:transglycosylase domain-containing protein [Cellulomonadaceae bacterium]
MARKVANKRRFWDYPASGYGPVRRWLPSWRVVLGTGLSVTAFGAGVFTSAWFNNDIPSNLDTVNDQLTTIYYSDGVTELGTLAKERRILVNYTTLPQYVGEAVVASEDQTFWTNIGVSPKGIARALYNNLKGGARQGASTITQQYIERYYTDTSTGYLGKAQEGILALKITQQQEKEQILQGYLNTIYWGRGTYGIEAASQAYFGHSATELSVSEAALLAGIIPSPSRWDPDVNEAQARFRWQRTLDYMAALGTISAEEAQTAVFPHYLPKPNYQGANAGQAGYLINEVVRELRAAPQFVGDPESIETRGLKIITTIDKDLQDEAVRIYEEIPREGDPHPASPQLQMALVALEPMNGEYKALYGGQDYATAQFNFATDGRAQGGSTFKPFTLIAALEDGHQLYERFDGNSGIPIEGWDSKSNLRNYGGISYGTIDLLTATANSVNTVYAQLNIEIGPEKTAEVAHRLGIPDVTNDQAPGYIAANAANVLGTASVRPVDLARAYATIAGGGYAITPHIVRDVFTLKGELIYRGPTERQLVAEPEVMAATAYAMERVVTSGSGRVAQQVKGPDGGLRDIAGKTGTANDNLAAWFAGFTPQLVTVVGIHQDTPDGRGEEPITPFGKWREMTGSSFPVTAWAEFMQVALEGQPVEKFLPYTMPPNPEPEPEELCVAQGESGEDGVIGADGEDGAIGTGCIPANAEDPLNPDGVPGQPGQSGQPEAPTVESRLVEIPTGLEGKPIADVAAVLKALGLQLATQYSDSDAIEPEHVISVQSAGIQVPEGSTITVLVSSGPLEVYVPAPEPSLAPIPELPTPDLPTPDLPSVWVPDPGTNPWPEYHPNEIG